jgi:hypothetical protein
MESMAELLPQHFAEIIATLKQGAAAAASREVRKAPRIEVSARVALRPISDGVPGQEHKVVARNISFRGVGLLSSRPFLAGEQFVVFLPRGRGEPLPVICECVHCREEADGLYGIGATFASVLTSGPPQLDEPNRLASGIRA